MSSVTPEAAFTCGFGGLVQCFARQVNQLPDESEQHYVDRALLILSLPHKLYCEGGKNLSVGAIIQYHSPAAVAAVCKRVLQLPATAGAPGPLQLPSGRITGISKLIDGFLHFDSDALNQAFIKAAVYDSVLSSFWKIDPTTVDKGLYNNGLMLYWDRIAQ